MTDHSVTLRLSGDLSVEDFAERAGLWAKMLSAVAEEVGRGVRWVISDLEYSSAIMTAAPIPDNDDAERFVPQLIHGYLEAARAVQKGQVADDRPSLRIVRRLVEKASPDAEVTFETPEDEVTFEGVPNRGEADQISFEAPNTWGTLRGRVETLSQRRGLRFTLYDMLTDRPVSCYVEPGKEELLRNIWGRLADVTGLIRRNPRTDRAVSIRRVSGIELIPDPMPGAFALARGAVVPAADSPSADVLIRQLRDAD